MCSIFAFWGLDSYHAEVQITCVLFISLLLWHASCRCSLQMTCFVVVTWYLRVFQVMFINSTLKKFCLHRGLKLHSTFVDEIMFTWYFFKLEEQIGQSQLITLVFFTILSFDHKYLFVFVGFIVLVIMNPCQCSMVISGFLLLVQVL